MLVKVILSCLTYFLLSGRYFTDLSGIASAFNFADDWIRIQSIVRISLATVLCSCPHVTHELKDYAKRTLGLWRGRKIAHVRDWFNSMRCRKRKRGTCTFVVYFMGARGCADNRNRGKQRERQGEKKDVLDWRKGGDVLQIGREKDVYCSDEKEELTGTWTWCPNRERTWTYREEWTIEREWTTGRSKGEQTRENEQKQVSHNVVSSVDANRYWLGQILWLILFTKKYSS